MRNSFLILGFLVFIAAKASLACSIGVNHEYQKDQLAGFAADHLSIELGALSSISEYDLTLADENPSTLCPETMNTEALVAFSYYPSKLKKCTAQVRVFYSQYIGEDPTISFVNLEFADQESGCIVTRLPQVHRQVRPIPPIRPVRPIRVVHPVRP